MFQGQVSIILIDKELIILMMRYSDHLMDQLKLLIHKHSRNVPLHQMFLGLVHTNIKLFLWDQNGGLVNQKREGNSTK
jgi:hypothetical protein